MKSAGVFLGGHMGKSIIIAEKPSVGKEYAKVLGVNGTGNEGFIENERWIVTWTVGHLITMSYPEKYDTSLKDWKLETIPFIPKQYRYEVIKESHRQFNVVKKLYNRPDIDVIYYAGDAGREGLYIQMLVRQFAGHNPAAIEKVVWIDSQTEEEILRGIADAKDISQYKTMSDAGYMRAIEDYLTGINFSRLLSVKYAVMLNSGSGQKKHKPISIGRVMTCVLGMIVNREREIRNFRPTYFYRVIGNLIIEGKEIECEWRETEGSNYFNSPKLYSEFGFFKKEDANILIGELEKELSIQSMTRTLERKNAPLLYNLAEIQSDAAKKLHISPGDTLKVLQSLYEKKLTTYPRTDARVLSTAIEKEISKNLSGLSNGAYKDYVKEINDNHWMIKGKYVDDSKITDHYAIIPTGKTPQELTKNEAAIYDMVCRRFLSVFYPPAEYERVKFEALSGKEQFFGTNKYLSSPGYYEVSGYPEEDMNSKEIVDAMNKLQKGKKYSASYSIQEGETTAPKRYTSGSIILAMENAGKLIEDDELREQISTNGIGTSATRAEVLEKLLKLNYIAVSEKKQVLVPSNFGEMIYEIVKETIPDMLSPEITAKWEKGLDQIARGEISKKEYEEQLTSYIVSICNKVKNMENKDEIIKKIRPYASSYITTQYKEFDPYNTSIKCPLCGDEVITTRWGFKCKSNISKTEGCSFVMGGDILCHRLLTNELAVLFHDGKVGPFYDFISNKGKPFAAYLVWDNTNKKLEFDLTNMPWEATDLKCPVCGKNIVKQGNLYKCEENIDFENGCSFRIGKICGKSIPEKQIESLIKTGQTELIKGFKKESGDKFDAFLIWSAEKKKIKFRFPTFSDMETKYKCPICRGKILATAIGYKCEKYKSQSERTESDCSFFAGTIMGHTIKEKELEQILSGGETELITFKNQEKKNFEAKLYWNNEEQRIAFKFDEIKEEELNLSCPICNSPIIKTKYGYHCSKRISKQEGCNFSIGNIAGILIDDVQLRKLVTQGKTDLISGFKPKEKGKNPFSAYLVWDKAEKHISFEFPNRSELKEKSNYMCPVCHQHKLFKLQYGYYCDCGFKVAHIIATKEIPEEQMKKLLLRGESDLIYGFFSQRTRKLFSAKLKIADNKVEFEFPEEES